MTLILIVPIIQKNQPIDPTANASKQTNQPEKFLIS